MKTRNKKIDNQLYDLFKEIYTDQDDIDNAVKDAKVVFSMLQQDAVFKEHYLDDEA